MGVCVKCVYIIPGHCVCDLELFFFVYIANMESLMMKKPHSSLSLCDCDLYRYITLQAPSKQPFHTSIILDPPFHTTYPDPLYLDTGTGRSPI
jgi:hypothetical protein